jgi:WD40 repeat protein
MSWAETMVIPGELREVRKIDADIGAGLWAKGEEDGSISLRGLNMEEEDPPEFSLKGHSGWLEIIRFHPSGKFLASGASDKTIRFWDIEEKTEVASFEVHDDYVTAIGFSPDGRIMVSGDYSGHLKVWDLSVSRSS